MKGIIKKFQPFGSMGDVTGSDTCCVCGTPLRYNWLDMDMVPYDKYNRCAPCRETYNREIRRAKYEEKAK